MSRPSEIGADTQSGPAGHGNIDVARERIEVENGDPNHLVLQGIAQKRNRNFRGREGNETERLDLRVQ